MPNISVRNILAKLGEIISPSSNEEMMRRYIISNYGTFVDRYSTDARGNLFLMKFGNNKVKKTLMIVAHMDEIGIIVTHIEENGLIRFDKIGGLDANTSIGHRVNLLTTHGVIPGVIGASPPHVKKENSQKIEISDLWIDIGATSKQESTSIVSIGDVGVIKYGFSELLGNQVTLSAADNKVGITILLSILSELVGKELENLDVIYVASSQEEIGLRGASALCQKYQPDYAIVLDVTHSSDYPGIKKAIYGDIKLGNGPVIPISADSSKVLQSFIRGIAIRNGIPFQIQAFARPTGTDLNAIQLRQQHTLTGLIAIPCRYMHSPNEVVSIKDIEDASNILTRSIEELDSVELDEPNDYRPIGTIPEE